ncbi:MAG: CPBP family intramembrane metalloprotease [archaeon]|nr:CPBP family intramembrane metalloprotease [archaeon]
MKLFPNDIWLKYIYPSIGFALWHIDPLSVTGFRLPGGIPAFVFFALLLGLTWGYYAQKTGSIRWCTIAHIIHDSFGLGAFTYIAWLS